MVSARVLILSLFLALSFPGGCVAVYPAMGLRASEPGTAPAGGQVRPEVPETDDAPRIGERWPARWSARPESPRGVVVPSTDRASSLRPAHLGRFHSLRTGEIEYRQAELLAKAVGFEDGFRFEAEGPGSLVFMPPVEPGEGEAGGDDAETFVFVSARPNARNSPEDPRVDLERTWFAFYEASTEETKGTIVLIPGMLGTPQPIIEGLVRYWRNSGYAVLRFLSHPSRFTERVEVPIREGMEAEAGRRLAEIYDERTAECAYAADAALTYLFSRRKPLADKPVVLVGMSGGAMVLPSVYSYAPERYHAAVLIAGGVNFLKISAMSNYAEWIDAITLDWTPDQPGTGRPTPDRLDRLSNAYLAASRMDATHTAPELAAIPVLVLHATRDRAVPSELGEALWRLLGTPERWVFNVGHELIFMMLPMQSGRLTSWIDGAIKPES